MTLSARPESQEPLGGRKRRIGQGNVFEQRGVNGHAVDGIGMVKRMWQLLGWQVTSQTAFIMVKAGKR